MSALYHSAMMVRVIRCLSDTDYRQQLGTELITMLGMLLFHPISLDIYEFQHISSG